MDVVFLAPNYPPEMRQFCRGLAQVGARVFGVGDAPPAQLPADLKPYLADYLQVPGLLREDDVVTGVRAWMAGRHVDRVETNWEPLVITAAKLREALGIHGMNVDTVRGFRDKQLMKERVAAAGLRVPRSKRARGHDEARSAARAVGYPLVIKPISGAGSANVYGCHDERELDEALRAIHPGTELCVEEYIRGDEFTYDALCIGGTPVYENVVQYFPKPMEGRSQQWISPAQITVRDLSQPHIRRGIELGRKVLSALHMGDGFVHMEWFLSESGEAVFGEIACRNGGAKLVDMMNYTSDIDLFREWARVVCWHRFEATTERKYNCGVVFKRAHGSGRITGITGLGTWLSQCGSWVVEEQLSRPGAERRDWKKTLLSDGWVAVRHPDWETCKRMCFAAVKDIKLYAE